MNQNNEFHDISKLLEKLKKKNWKNNFFTGKTDFIQKLFEIPNQTKVGQPKCYDLTYY